MAYDAYIELWSVDDSALQRRCPVIHVRFGGASFDLPLSSLDIGATSSDEQIRRAVATNLRVPPSVSTSTRLTVIPMAI